MRVTWVHPSWRDLVIATLAGDAATRRRFLARCGVDGAALALSGDDDGRRPLLREDADWDALGDGLHHVCAELDEAAAVRLLLVLEAAGNDPEVLGLAQLVLARLGWSGRAVGVDALCAWAPVAARLTEPPAPPAVAMTWLEVEPSGPPQTPEELNQFADWLRLAELLRRYDDELLSGLGFPDRHADTLSAFADQRPFDEPVLERELRIESLARLAELDPGRAPQALEAIAELGIVFPEPITEFDELDPPPPAAEFPVERVLRDLG